MAVPPPPSLFGYEPLNPGDQDVLIVGSVEDGDSSVLGHLEMDPPQVVMGLFPIRRSSKAPNPDSLRIHTFEDMADRPVFTSGVHCLENNQEFLLRLGP